MGSSVLKQWFNQQRSQPSSDYEHLWLQQLRKGQWKPHLPILKEYFEAAHLDARQYFHENAGISLHPLRNLSDESEIYCYPNDLDQVTKSGLFGEVLNGFLIEHAAIIGEGSWKVPVFLFRHHQDVENHIHELNHGIRRRKRTVGRLGNDCLGITVDDTGKVTGIITGESKFRSYLPEKVGATLNKKVHESFCNEADVPVNLMKLTRLLETKDPDRYQNTIASLEALNKKQQTNYTRQHIYSLIVCKTKKNYPPTYIDQTQKHKSYTIKRPLQTVEVIISDGKDLLENLYDCLYVS